MFYHVSERVYLPMLNCMIPGSFWCTAMLREHIGNTKNEGSWVVGAVKFEILKVDA
jgi:hypothetical protein